MYLTTISRRNFHDFALRNLNFDTKAQEMAERPQMRFILDRFQYALGKRVILRGPVQTLKNGSASIAMYSKTFLSPCRMGYYAPTGKLLESFLDSKFDATWQANALLQGICNSNDERQHKIHYRSLPNGFIQFLTSKSKADRQSHSFAFIVIDEAWLIERENPGALSEIEGRSKDFEDTAIIIYLTNGYDSDKTLAAMCRNAMRYRFVVPCDACAQPMHYLFFKPKHILYENRTSDLGHKIRVNDVDRFQPYGGMHWNQGDDVLTANGEINFEKLGKSVYYECEHCGHRHRDSLADREARNKRALDGDFALKVDGTPYPIKDGYLHLNPESGETKIEHIENSSLSFRSWQGIVEQYVKARERGDMGKLDDLEDFYRKELAMPWNPQQVMQSSRHVEQNRGEYRMAKDKQGYDEILKEWGERWQDAWVFMTVDVQKGHYWYVIRAWQQRVGSRLILCGKIYQSDDIIHLSDRFQISTLPGDHAFGVDPQTGKYRILPEYSTGVGLDGNYEPARVQRLCAANGWMCLRGKDTAGFNDSDNILRPYSSMVPADALNGLHFSDQMEIEENKRYCPEVSIANDMARNQFQQLRETQSRDTKKAFWTYAQDSGSDYESHMRAWYRKAKLRTKDGNEDYVWHKVRQGERDDLYWCEKAQFIMATMHGFWG